MIKYFCDFCNAEISDLNRASGGAIHCPDRLGTSLKKKGFPEIHVEIITGMDGVSNQGIACRHCILDALKKLDNRVKDKP